MPELSAILKASRDKTHEDRRFFAALQGVDLDKQAGEAKFKEIMESVGATQADPMDGLFDVEDMTDNG
jgi:hypothetical protein